MLSIREVIQADLESATTEERKETFRAQLRLQDLIEGVYGEFCVPEGADAKQIQKTES